MNTDTTDTIFDTAEVSDAHRTSLAGVFGSVSALAGVGAAYVAITRQDGGAVAQMAVVAVVCGGIAVSKARAAH
ncbi:MAG: hypothetical protein Q7V88_13940 [Actinomycetota bacterium]|nr:hypothetical protein [Actinomycetota bacterium]